MTDTTNTLPAGAPKQQSTEPAGDFTPEQQRQMADWAVEDKRMTREEANTMLAAGGASAPAGSVSEVDAHLASIGYEPAKPHEYELPAPADQTAPYDAEWQSTTRTWLSTARLDRAMGSAIAGYAAETHPRWESMEDAGRELYTNEQRSQLERLGFTADRIELAQQLVAEIEAKSPGLVDYLEATGAGSDYRVVAQLVMHAERLSGRHPKG